MESTVLASKSSWMQRQAEPLQGDVQCLVINGDIKMTRVGGNDTVLTWEQNICVTRHYITYSAVRYITFTFLENLITFFRRAISSTMLLPIFFEEASNMDSS